MASLGQSLGDSPELFLMKIHDNVYADEELHCNQTDYNNYDDHDDHDDDDHDYDDDRTREGMWMGLQ